MAWRAGAGVVQFVSVQNFNHGQIVHSDVLTQIKTIHRHISYSACYYTTELMLLCISTSKAKNVCKKLQNEIVKSWTKC